MSETKTGASPVCSATAKGSRSRLNAVGRDGLTVAGTVPAVVLIANIISFGALMFPGNLNAGAPIAVCSMLVASCICGVWIALATSLPPLASGTDIRTQQS